MQTSGSQRGAPRQPHVGTGQKYNFLGSTPGLAESGTRGRGAPAVCGLTDPPGVLILVKCEARAPALCVSESRCAGLSHQLRTPGLEMGKGAVLHTGEDTAAWEGSALPRAERTPAAKLERGTPTPGPTHSQSCQIYLPRTLSSPPLLLIFNPFLPFPGGFLSPKYITLLLFNQGQISMKI